MSNLTLLPASGPAARALPASLCAQLATLLALFGALYTPVFAILVRSWWGSDIYRHGFLVPFISLFLVWRMRARLAQLPPAPSYAFGVPLVLLAGLMLFVGKLGAVIAVLQELSLLVMIAGLVLLLLGPLYLKALALPILYLLFMIPLLADHTDWVHWPFQLLAANVGVWLLQSVGIPALREAQFIALPRITLEVAEACSGIRLMISVIAIGIPLAYVTQRTWPRRVILVACAVVIGILANSFRVAAIGVWAYFGGEVLKGPFHVLQAMFAAWVGYVALFVGAWLLAREPGR